MYSYYIYVVVTQDCTDGFIDHSKLTYRASGYGLPLSNQLRVLQEYQFDCSTSITGLILGLEARNIVGTFTLYPSVQLFRYNATTGLHHLVSERMIYYTLSNITANRTVNYTLNPPFSVEAKDLLAVAQPIGRNSVLRIYYINGMSSTTYRYGLNSRQLNLTTGFTTINTQLILLYPVTTSKSSCHMHICYFSGLVSKTLILQIFWSKYLNRVKLDVLIMLKVR